MFVPQLRLEEIEMKLSRHHTWTERCRKGNTEVKKIDPNAHRNWHNLVGDMSPNEAIRYIAINFMPSDYELDLLEVIK